MISLKWYQVNGWRLSQHSLSQRLKCQDFVKAVTQTGGIQAQVMSAAELALWARTDGLVVQNVKSALWWGLRTVPARKLFQSIENELADVNVEGWHALALQTTLEPMQNLKMSGEVRLLPLFDAYTFGLGRDIEALLPKIYKSLVFRPQGWISAVILVNGCIKGVWEYKTQRAQTTVKVRMFSTPTTSLKKSIEAELERLSAFLNTKVVLEFENF